MTVSELLASRDTAGARYAKAVAELHDALIDFGSIDEALHNAMASDARRNVY